MEIKIGDLVKTKTFAHSTITFGATFINGVLGTLFFILLARNLGPEKFGMVSIAILTLTLIADIADFGINTGLINFISKYLNQDIKQAYRYMKLGLKLKLMIWLIVASLGYLLSPFISEKIFLKDDLVMPLRLAFIGVGSAMLFSFVTNSLQAFQRYIQWSVINILSNGLRLLLVVVLALMAMLQVDTALTLYILMPTFFFLVGLLILPNKFFYVKGENEVMGSFFNYNKWVALSILIAAVGSRLDTLILTRLVEIKEVGYYSVATQLTSVIPQFVYALAVVVAPKLGSFNDDKQAIKYLKKLQLLCVGLFLLGLFGIPVGSLLIPYIYGPEYINSILPFGILLLSQLLFLLATPAHQAIFYYFSTPKIFSLFTFIQLLVTAVLGWYLTNQMGIMGAAIAMFVGSLVNFLLPTIWVIRKFQK